LAGIGIATAMHPGLHAEPHCPGNVAPLHFHPSQLSVVITSVIIDHSGPFDFMVDTGAQITTIDSSLAAELHLSSLGTVGIVGVADYTQHAPLVRVHVLEAGTHAVKDLSVAVQNLGALHSLGPPVRVFLEGISWDILMC
jgi:hypothetical protein